MFAGMYPVTKEEDDELSSVDPHYFYRYKYRFPDPVRSDIMFNNTLANKIYVRNKLISNFDLDIVIKDPHLKHSMDNLNIIKHYTITKDLPKLPKDAKGVVYLKTQHQYFKWAVAFNSWWKAHNSEAKKRN